MKKKYPYKSSRSSGTSLEVPILFVKRWIAATEKKFEQILTLCTWKGLYWLVLFGAVVTTILLKLVCLPNQILLTMVNCLVWAPYLHPNCSVIHT